MGLPYINLFQLIIELLLNKITLSYCFYVMLLELCKLMKLHYLMILLYMKLQNIMEVKLNMFDIMLF